MHQNPLKETTRACLVFLLNSGHRHSLQAVLMALLFLLICSQVNAFELPSGAKKGQPGSYDISIPFGKYRDAKDGVRILLYIPQFKNSSSKNRPTVVFYHGSTRDRQYYRTGVSYMIQRANAYGFTLLSVQNWWAFTDYTESIIDSRAATNILLWKLVEEGVIRKDAVYTSGFSGGGLAAMMVVHNSLDEPGLEREKPAYQFPYAGFASIKGNFYAGIGTFVMNPLIDLDGDGQQKHYRKMYKNKIVYITVGGAHDAARVQKQAPEARDFFRDYLGLGDQVIYKQFAQEGHNFPETNWKPFWDLVEKEL
jgi:hypothetical protein